ncbi:MAG: PorV/PorQ family protein [Balneolaceae bacterium]|nr:PorV/PorQ family protein [Balneolaceae bacterium]
MIRFFSALVLTAFLYPVQLTAQSSQAKYGNDFLSTGGGARALGMGSAQVALANDVTAGYWNVAGLTAMEQPQLIYMHAERFNGIVGYDYGAAAMPLDSDKGVVALSFFRQGVDNIANTLNAWDRERNQPKENVEDYITKFSAADMALFFSYAKKRSQHLSYGASVKIIHQKLGPFAQAWGYSLDVGATLKTSIADLGISVRDVTTMQKMWSIDEDQFEGVATQFDSLGATLPTGQNEFVLPSLKIGASRMFNVRDFDILAAVDADLLFENRQAYYINMGSMSVEPHIGTEVTYKNRISLRTGLTDFVTDPEAGFSVSPTLGMGLKLSSFVLDYGFASFAGASSNLGFTHRISLRFDI